MKKGSIYILILFTLFSFSLNVIIKCDGKGVVNIECHSDDCNKEKTSNDDCSHCLTINNFEIITPAKITSPDHTKTFYPAYSDNYNFQIINSFLRPPQA